MSEMIFEIPIDKIRADAKFNCRLNLVPFDVQQLSENIRQNGLIQPITVRTKQPDDTFKEEYDLVAGFRRRLACIMAGMQTIKCIVRNDLTARQAAIINLSENLNRTDLNILEEAEACKKLLETGFKKSEIASDLGKSLTWLQIRLNLLELPNDIQEEVQKGVIKQQHINQLHRIKDTDKLYPAVKKLKAAIERGEAATSVEIIKTESKPTTVKVRKPNEIQDLINFMLENIGESLATIVLAWAKGNVNNSVLWEELKKANPNLQIPVDYSIPTMEPV